VIDFNETVMLENVVGLAVSVGLLVYLTYALLRPEKF
jgi:K+-transporting ATPase KdpF subunit